MFLAGLRRNNEAIPLTFENVGGNFHEEGEKMSLKKIHADVWLGILFIAASVFFYKMTDEFFYPEAAVWPRAVLIVTATLSAMLLINGIRLTKLGKDSGIPEGHVFFGPVVAIIVITAYAAAMEFTGYFMSTAVFLPLGMFIQGQKNWKVIIGVTAGLEIFVYLLFVVGLSLRMP